MRCIKCGAYDTFSLLCLSCINSQPVLLFKTSKYIIEADENDVIVREVGNNNIIKREYIDAQIRKLIFPKLKVTISNDSENGDPSKFLRLVNLIGIEVMD